MKYWDFLKKKYRITLLINQKRYLDGWKWTVRFVRLKNKFEKIEIFKRNIGKYRIMLLINQKRYLDGWKWIVRFVRLKIKFWKIEIFKELDFE